jgi:hypothetical protein
LSIAFRAPPCELDHKRGASKQVVVARRQAAWFFHRTAETLSPIDDDHFLRQFFVAQFTFRTDAVHRHCPPIIKTREGC